MTDRREFLGAMAALFCGVALPEPVREAIWLPHGNGMLLLDESVGMSADLDALIKKVFVGPVREALKRPAPSLFNERQLLYFEVRAR